MKLETNKRRPLIEGNTKSINGKQDVQRLYYCFTLFYNDDLEIEILETSLKRFCLKYIIGKEIAPTTLKKHLQGFLKLDKKRRFSQVIKLLPKGIHLEATLGSEQDNEIYCKKENDFIEWINPAVAVSKIEYELTDIERDLIDNIINSPRNFYEITEQSDNFMKSLYDTHKCGFFIIKDIRDLLKLPKSKMIHLIFSGRLDRDDIECIKEVIDKGFYLGKVLQNCKYIIIE